jgi:hypothetical protein
MAFSKIARPRFVDGRTSSGSVLSKAWWVVIIQALSLMVIAFAIGSQWPWIEYITTSSSLSSSPSMWLPDLPEQSVHRRSVSNQHSNDDYSEKDHDNEINDNIVVDDTNHGKEESHDDNDSDATDRSINIDSTNVKTATVKADGLNLAQSNKGQLKLKVTHFISGKKQRVRDSLQTVSSQKIKGTRNAGKKIMKQYYAPLLSATISDMYSTTTNVDQSQAVVYRSPGTSITNNTSTGAHIPVVPVVMWPYLYVGAKASLHNHLYVNGIAESKYLTMSKDIMDFRPYVVWIAQEEYGIVNKASLSWCLQLAGAVARAQKRRNETGHDPFWPLRLLDFRDLMHAQRCPEVEALVGSHNVEYSRRSKSYHRKWQEDTKWIDFGREYTFADFGGYYRHTPYFVRTDIIESLHSFLHSTRNVTLKYPIESLPRPVDVAHFWHHNTTHIDSRFYSFRSRVSELLFDMHQQRYPTWNLQLGIQGNLAKAGRSSVHDDYLNSMLQAKIIVVTQRDDWEDHYRLFEALSTGAMVMTDFMHGLPTGLLNGTSIGVFTTPQNLESLLVYYLSNDEIRLDVAHRGREVAMSRHRSWHRMEEVVFGAIVTECVHPDCPYVVHAQEGYSNTSYNTGLTIQKKG